jgi:hypothetical protein
LYILFGVKKAQEGEKMLRNTARQIVLAERAKDRAIKRKY